jgi:hypothetical protein
VYALTIQSPLLEFGCAVAWGNDCVYWVAWCIDYSDLGDNLVWEFTKYAYDARMVIADDVETGIFVASGKFTILIIFEEGRLILIS